MLGLNTSTLIGLLTSSCTLRCVLDCIFLFIESHKIKREHFIHSTRYVIKVVRFSFFEYPDHSILRRFHLCRFQDLTRKFTSALRWPRWPNDVLSRALYSRSI
jgi:hypothetical protein